MSRPEQVTLLLPTAASGPGGSSVGLERQENAGEQRAQGVQTRGTSTVCCCNCLPLLFFFPSLQQTLQNLRQELDDLLQEKIENPHPVDWNDIKSRDTAVLTAIIDLITTQENESARNYAPRFQGERYS